MLDVEFTFSFNEFINQNLIRSLLSHHVLIHGKKCTNRLEKNML